MIMKIKYIDIINEKLKIKRHENDASITLNLPEHKFKKYGEKLNWAISETYKEFANQGILMYHIVLSLQDYFDVVWLINNVLSIDNKNIIKAEIINENKIFE